MCAVMPRSIATISTSPALSVSDLTDDVGDQHGPYLEGNLQLLHTLECHTDVMCCRFSPDSALLAVGFIDATIKVYSADSGKLFYSLSDSDTVKAHLPVTQLRFCKHRPEDKTDHRSHILIATYASGHVKLWHISTAKCLHTIKEARQTLTSCMNPTGTYFLTAGDDQKIHIYDQTTKTKLITCEPSDSREVMDGHVYRVFALQYHPYMPNLFLSGGWDNTVQYWDDRQEQSIRKISGPHICGDALDIDPEHNHIVTGSWRRSDVLQIWDLPSGKKIKDVPQDTMNQSLLYCAQWIGKDNVACGGSDHNMARVIDRGTLNTVGQLVDLPQGVYCIDNDRQGNHPRLAIGSAHYIFLVQTDKRS